MDYSSKIPEKLLKSMICCLSDNGDHIVKNAHLISCGGNACEKCLESVRMCPKLCDYCNEYHTINDYSQSMQNPNVTLLVESFQIQLIDFFKNKLNRVINSIRDDTLEKTLNENLNLIQIEIEIQIESAKKMLEAIREDLMIEVNKIRSCWKKYAFKVADKISVHVKYIFHLRISIFPLKEAELVKKVIDSSDNIYEIQDKCIELEQIVKDCAENLKSIKFLPNSIHNIDKNLIGHLQYPSLINFNKARVILNKKYESTDFLGLVLHANEVCLVDYISKCIHMFSRDGHYLSDENPNKMLIKPTCICVNKLKQILIGDYGSHQVIIFNSDFNFVKKIGPIEYPIGMVADDSNGALIYVTDCLNNLIYIIDTNERDDGEGFVVKKKYLDSPSYIKEQENKLFIISFTEYETKSDRKLTSIMQGSNCIYVLNKASLNLEKTIKFDRWLCPKGLHLDTDKNILTIAHLVDLNSNISTHPFVFLINQNGNCLKAIELYSIKQVDNFIYFDRTLFACYSNEINLIQIE